MAWELTDPIYSIENDKGEVFVGTDEECMEKVHEWYGNGLIDIPHRDDDLEDGLFEYFERNSEEIMDLQEGR